jgi:benzoyl-CoA reductase/2-hydroxyglutaryl-CoA dehydratase subunit BcrC/BadD/HgdB
MIENFIPDSVKDEWIRYKTWMMINAFSGGLVARAPFGAIKTIYQQPWMFDFLKSNSFFRNLSVGRTGRNMEASGVGYAYTVKAIVDMLANAFNHPERTVLIENMVPPEIPWAMGLNTFVVEAVARVLAMHNQHSVHKYIDVAANAGLPVDSCGLNRSVTGTILMDSLPKGCAIYTSNMPCDAGMCSYATLQERTKLPIYRLDIPYNFREDQAIDAFVEDLKGAIKFFEQNTPGRMDWDKLKEILDRYNEAVSYELETWELLRNHPAPITGDAIWQPHYLLGNAYPGSQIQLDCCKKVNKLARANVAEGKPAFPGMRYRAAFWNPPTPAFPYIWNWLERSWGIGILMDMETYGYTELNDTSSNEAMLRSLAKRYMWGPMARHSRGPAENFFGDLFRMYEELDLDFIIHAQHLGCKGSMGLTGLIRERCRERNIPLCVIDYELMDTRVVSRQGMRDQVNQFMTDIMKVEPLDPSALVYDDSKDW